MSSVPITEAVTSGDAGAVSAVLANGADVNERTGGGQTPLILATIFGHTHLIPLLLKAGADPQLRDNLGLNAVDWAQRRGATEAFEILKDKNKSKRAKTYSRAPEQPAIETPAVTPRAQETPVSKPVSADERSRRWIAGLKQRITEQSNQETTAGPNLFRSQPEAEAAPPPPPELPPPEPEPEPQIEEISKPVEEVPRPRSTRKRCPKCNAIYNSDLLAYCAHHIVPLVDADAPIISEPAKQSPVMFWVLIVITLSGSIVLASLIATYFYNSNKTPEAAASAPAAPQTQKGIPVASREFTGRVVSLPMAECPLKGQEAIPGTVVVQIAVDKKGRVKSARASGGDWLLRGAATEAAMKSTFSPQKLRSRETEGTITYTFEP